MKKKLFSIFLLLVFFMMPILLTACNTGGGSDDDTGGDDEEQQESLVDLGDYFEGVNTASSTDSNPSAAVIALAFRTMAGLICENLLYEYGYQVVLGDAVSIVVDDHDTHAYAIVQDGWNWGVYLDDDTSIVASEFDATWQSQINYTDVLTYNMLSIVQGLEPLAITSVEDYNNYKNAGKFSDDSLIKLANPINHTGLYYYELDRIAEYILDEVIGEEVVARDNTKFINNIGASDNTKTFDSNEYFDFGSSFVFGMKNYINLIADNNNTNLRSEDTSRTKEWNSINWNTVRLNNASMSLVEFDSSNNDIRVSLNQFLDFGCASDEYRQLRYLDGGNLVSQPIEEELEEGVTPIYSGFKNYVNTIYYIVYSVTKTSTMASFFLNPIAYIEDIHLSQVGVSDAPGLDSAFLTPAYQYKSLVIKAKQAVTINYISLWFELDSSITQEVKLEVKGRYQYCTTSHTHVHTQLCQFEVKEYNFGIVTIKPGKMDPMPDVSGIDPDDYFSGDVQIPDTVKAGGILDFDLTEPNEQGNVELIYLSKFQKPISLDQMLPGMEIDTWQDGYVTAPTASFLSALFQYRNDRSEFLEFCFNVVEGPSDAKFKFALFQLDIETGE